MAANDAALPIHPLIKGLAVGLTDPATQQTLVDAKATAIAARADWNPPPNTNAQVSTNTLENFVKSQRVQVVTFAGYLGPPAEDPKDSQKYWRFLFQDAKARSWLLVPEDAIVLHDRACDRKAAFQQRDLIWVKADAPVRQGNQDESAAGRFLVGQFTNAGDLHATLTDASPPSPGSGILCAPTPECCSRYTR